MRRKDTKVPAPLYARLVIVVLSVALAATLIRHGVQYVVRRAENSGGPTRVDAAGLGAPAATVAAWQADTLASIESGAREAQAGNITAAEVALDRAASLMEAARAQSRGTTPDFFDVASGSLDRVLQLHPENNRLFEHVTMARVNLAQLRSALSGATGPEANATGPPDHDLASDATGNASIDVGRGVHPSPATGKSVVIAAPQAIGADHLLNSGVLGGDSIDATLMPETVEILLPPSTRLFVDNVRVENLTLEGASQTLDGIHWKNVTFIGTRLRYESGELDLQNVRFIRCTFGLATDQRGARLANAIARGQSSITIE